MPPVNNKIFPTLGFVVIPEGFKNNGRAVPKKAQIQASGLSDLTFGLLRNISKNKTTLSIKMNT